jgi:hypothetical protein
MGFDVMSGIGAGLSRVPAESSLSIHDFEFPDRRTMEQQHLDTGWPGDIGFAEHETHDRH